MYEVEMKIELSEEEKVLLEKTFIEKGFELIKTTPQKDCYVEAERSPFYDEGASYDVKRYRNENGLYIYTEKIWEKINDDVARKQEEYEVTKEKFEEATRSCPTTVSIKKIRDWYSGAHEGYDISLTIDTVDFDHSSDTRYFVEAEISVEDKGNVQPTKEIIESFFKSVLEKDEIIQSPSMFTMAFEGK